METVSSIVYVAPNLHNFHEYYAVIMKITITKTACSTGLGTLKSQNDGESQKSSKITKIIQDHKNIQSQKFRAIYHF